MAWSVGDVDQGLAAALGKVADGIGYMSTASVALEESGQALGVALTGATAAEALDALATHEAASSQVAEIGNVLRAVVGRIEAYRKQLGAESPVFPASPHQEGTAGTAAGRRGAHPRSALPRPPRPGKTHGRWVTRDGETVMLESGRGGEYYHAARKRAVDLGMTYGRPQAEAAIARHVEIQFAERMRAQGIMHAEIEINRRVCGTRAGKDDDLPDTCDKQLPRFLPPGATLRVKDGSSLEGTQYKGKEGDG